MAACRGLAGGAAKCSRCCMRRRPRVQGGCPVYAGCVRPPPRLCPRVEPADAPPRTMGRVHLACQVQGALRLPAGCRLERRGPLAR
eukprot:7736650-Alexandrium_andersonii.AAC.1